MATIPFIGRKEELKELSLLVQKKTASLVVIHGKKRIGKSRLVEEFAKGMRLLSFSGLAPTPQTTAQSQRDEFARQLEENLHIRGIKGDDWGDLFTFLAKQTTEGRCIIFLDELTWMGSHDHTFLGKLKIVWDLHFSKNPELILILCGSVSAWIEKNIISSTGFFGRISLKLLLEELSLPNCNALLEAVGFRGSDTEKLMILSVTGGIPWYLEQIQPSLSATENIKRLCFVKNGILLDEYKHIFHDLFGRRSELYQQIVSFLAEGPAEYKAISEATGYQSSGALSEYLHELVLSGYIARDHSWSFATGKELAVFRYRLSDNYLRFFLHYVEPHYQKIQRNQFAFTSLSSLPAFNTMMGFQIENLVLQNRSLIQARLGINPHDIINDNPYYQRKTVKQPGCQIDYLVQTRFRTLYVCEVKFSQHELPATIIQHMQEKLARFSYPKGFAALPVLIHANGVSEALKESDYFAHSIDLSKLLE